MEKNIHWEGIPPNFLKNKNRLANWLFGTVSSFDQQLLRQIPDDTNPVFFKWAVNQVVLSIG